MTQSPHTKGCAISLALWRGWGTWEARKGFMLLVTYLDLGGFGEPLGDPESQGEVLSTKGHMDGACRASLHPPLLSEGSSEVFLCPPPISAWGPSMHKVF